MPRAPGLLALAAALAAGPACAPPFRCKEDRQCDAEAGGRCVASECVYPGAGTSPPATTTASSAETSAASTSETSTSETTAAETTGEPASCEPWDVVLADAGKATDLALAPDGGVFVVGVTDVAPFELRVRRLGPDGAVRWSHVLAETHSTGIDDDTDVWARVFVHGPADELVVLYTRRMSEGSVKLGPFVHRVSASDGASLDLRDDLARSYHSLRGATMADTDALLLAGERQENIWYQRATRSGDTWATQWPAEPVPFDEAAKFNDPAIAQAIAPLGAAVVVGGTWDHEPDDDVYSAWLRRLDPGTGATECACDLQGAGLMAMAPTRDGDLFVAGLAQDGAQSQLWVGKLPTGCPLDCAPVWQDLVAGKSADTYFVRAELVRDAAFTLLPLPSGGLIVGGAVDKRPWAARYTDDGTRPWLMDISAKVSAGAVLAAAVSADERCLTLAGSKDYFQYGVRRWWVRRVALPA